MCIAEWCYKLPLYQIIYLHPPVWKKDQILTGGILSMTISHHTGQPPQILPGYRLPGACFKPGPTNQPPRHGQVHLYLTPWSTGEQPVSVWC